MLYAGGGHYGDLEEGVAFREVEKWTYSKQGANWAKCKKQERI